MHKCFNIEYNESDNEESEEEMSWATCEKKLILYLYI